MTFKQLFWERETAYAKETFGSEVKFREAIKEVKGSMPNFANYRKKGMLPPFTYLQWIEEFLNDDELDMWLDVITAGNGVSDEVDEEISEYRLDLELSNEYKVNKRMKRKAQRGAL